MADMTVIVGDSLVPTLGERFIHITLGTSYQQTDKIVWNFTAQDDQENDFTGTGHYDNKTFIFIIDTLTLL